MVAAVRAAVRARMHLTVQSVAIALFAAALVAAARPVACEDSVDDGQDKGNGKNRDETSKAKGKYKKKVLRRRRRRRRLAEAKCSAVAGEAGPSDDDPEIRVGPLRSGGISRDPLFFSKTKNRAKLLTLPGPDESPQRPKTAKNLPSCFFTTRGSEGATRGSRPAIQLHCMRRWLAGQQRLCWRVQSRRPGAGLATRAGMMLLVLSTRRQVRWSRAPLRLRQSTRRSLRSLRCEKNSTTGIVLPFSASRGPQRRPGPSENDSE